MEKITFERAKEIYQSDAYAQARKELAISIGTLIQLLINKGIINEEEYDEYEEIVRKSVEDTIDNRIHEEVDKFNKDMEDPKKQLEAMFKYLF